MAAVKAFILEAISDQLSAFSKDKKLTADS
jgi:hypothetical protein